MNRCAVCGQSNLVVTNNELDAAVMSGVGSSVSWEIPDADEARLVRSRLYYSARIHGQTIKTSYKNSRLQVEVKS